MDVSGRVFGSVRSRDGTPIAFERSGSGPPLVLIHGTSADRRRWARVLPLLEPRFTVFAVDRRGRGDSGDASAYALEREFEDVAAVTDSIGRPVTLLGHSHGAICALEASLRTSAVRRLILYEPPIPLGVEIYRPGIIERLQALDDAGDREALVTLFSTEVVRASPDQLEAMRASPAWEGRLAAAHTLVREVRANEEYVFSPERWAGFRTPTLLLLGGDSAEFFAASIQALADALPLASRSVLPGQQHAAMDTAPELFAREIVRFAADG